MFHRSRNIITSSTNSKSSDSIVWILLFYCSRLLPLISVVIVIATAASLAIDYHHYHHHNFGFDCSNNNKSKYHHPIFVQSLPLVVIFSRGQHCTTTTTSSIRTLPLFLTTTSVQHRTSVSFGKSWNINPTTFHRSIIKNKKFGIIMTTTNNKDFVASAAATSMLSVIPPSSSEATSTSVSTPTEEDDDDNGNETSSSNKRQKIDDTNNDDSGTENIRSMMEQAVQDMNDFTKRNIPFTANEMKSIVQSVQDLISDKEQSTIDFQQVQDIVYEVAHLSHKDWARTEEYGNKLGTALQLSGLSSSSSSGSSLTTTSTNSVVARTILRRIVSDGNWDDAIQHTITNNNRLMADSNFIHPWAVLVTGVNGIRKTTSIYQPWFPKLLQEALVAPTSGLDSTVSTSSIDVTSLPVGSNTFFRQLDHIIATICNNQFATLYKSISDILIDLERTTNTDDNDDQTILQRVLSKDPPADIIQLYSNYKAGIFTRYRTLSELVGAHLLGEAKRSSINCMLETSGRDVAMFHYIDHFFPAGYRKLVLHFTINDLSYAQNSVDKRMIHEIQNGICTVSSTSSSGPDTTSAKIQRIIQVNEGGPYGSDVLPGVQRDSDNVWNQIIIASSTNSDDNNNDNKDEVVVGKDWYKASIQINANPTEPWTAQAILPNGTLGTKYTFLPK